MSFTENLENRETEYMATTNAYNQEARRLPISCNFLKSIFILYTNLYPVFPLPEEAFSFLSY